MVNKFRRNKAQITFWLQSVFLFVWSIVGIIAIVLVAIAVFGGDSWVENLKLADTSEPEQAQPAQPQQPAQPTQEQLDCVSEELGQERFSELQQGGQATTEETTTIQECLQS